MRRESLRIQITHIGLTTSNQSWLSIETFIKFNFEFKTISSVSYVLFTQLQFISEFRIDSKPMFVVKPSLSNEDLFLRTEKKVRFNKVAVFFLFTFQNHSCFLEFIRNKNFEIGKIWNRLMSKTSSVVKNLKTFFFSIFGYTCPCKVRFVCKIILSLKNQNAINIF